MGANSFELRKEGPKWPLSLILAIFVRSVFIKETLVVVVFFHNIIRLGQLQMLAAMS